MMKMIADGLLLDAASMGAPGIDEVRWLKPVRPGDSLTVRGSVPLGTCFAKQTGPRLRQLPAGRCSTTAARR